jgi:hypothetical protein
VARTGPTGARPMLTLMGHSIVRGFGIPAARCACGAALTVVFEDKHGRIWSKCAKDSVDPLVAFGLLTDQSEASYLELARHWGLPHGPAVTAELINTRVPLATFGV